MPRYLGPTCSSCGVVSPVTTTSYTRVSLAGWRSIRRRDANEASRCRWTIEWRCRTCWLVFKARGGMTREITRSAHACVGTLRLEPYDRHVAEQTLVTAARSAS